MAGNPTAVKVGPGRLYFAAVGAAEPNDLTAEWGEDWVSVGYTEEGHAFNYSPSYEPVEVAEELDPIRYEPGSREMNVEFAMAEVTAANISKAFNGGTIETSEGVTTFEPPEIGQETRVAIGWESNDRKERWIFRKCLQTGDVEISRRKAPDKATISTTFMLEVVQGQKPFRAIFANDSDGA